MSRFPNVRPGRERPQQTHAPRRQDPRIEKATREAASQLFKQRGGERLQRALRLIEATLDVYEQDLARAKRDENPEKFKWRVKPGEALRCQRELMKLMTMIELLEEDCARVAGELIAEHLSGNGPFEPPEELRAPAKLAAAVAQPQGP